MPRADAVFGEHRRRLASDAPLGVPAHFTVLFPFVPLDEIDDEVRGTVSTAVGSIRPFDVELTTAAWFGDDVLWLAPESDAPLREVTDAVESAFPSLRPYGGAHAETIPHLTIGDGKPRHMLATAEREVTRYLPHTEHVDAVTLLAERSDGTWHPLDVFDFGG